MPVVFGILVDKLLGWGLWIWGILILFGVLETPSYLFLSVAALFAFGSTFLDHADIKALQLVQGGILNAFDALTKALRNKDS